MLATVRTRTIEHPAVVLAGTLLAVLMLIHSTPLPAVADEHDEDTGTDWTGDAYDSDEGVEVEIVAPGHGTVTSPPHATDDGLVWVSWPALSSQDGEVCIGTTGARVDPDDATVIRLENGWDFEATLIAYLQDGNPMPPPCPGAEPVVDIFDEVRAIVREAMPVPTPALQPQSGWKAGMPVYLMLNRPNDHDPEPQTVNLAGFGQVTVTMSASVRSWVDWGDPHNPPAREEVTGRVGREWDRNLAHDANGSITHTYTHVGGYTITIEDVWTVEVQIAGLPPRTIEVTMDAVTINLDIGQAQAVVTG